MLDRLLILLTAAAVGAALWRVARWWRADRLRRLRGERLLDGLVAPGRPAVIAFSTPQCGECRARQAPALARLAADLDGRALVRSLSALDHPELIARLGILTVPATIVVDAAGAVRQVNLGFTDAARLTAQLRAVLPDTRLEANQT